MTTKYTNIILINHQGVTMVFCNSQAQHQAALPQAAFGTSFNLLFHEFRQTTQDQLHRTLQEFWFFRSNW